MLAMKKTICLFCILIFAGCAGKPEVVVDMTKVTDKEQYEKDKNECVEVAMNFERTEKETGSAALGAAGGAGVAAGVATAVAGAVFWPAVPFIIGAAVVGGGAGGAVSSSKTEDIRQKIVHKCMEERGYIPLL